MFGHEFNNDVKVRVIDIMDNVIFDLLYQDMVERIEELGYKKVQGLRIDENIFITYKKGTIHIGFSGINDENGFCKWKQGLFGIKSQDITINELKAINKQVEELGWK